MDFFLNEKTITHNCICLFVSFEKSGKKNGLYHQMSN